MNEDSLTPHSRMKLNTSLGAPSKRSWVPVSQREGGYSKYHDEDSPDVIFQFGTGYFGCRTKEGRFCDDSFSEIMSKENVRMAEVKINEGAKPGYGALLPCYF